MRAVPNPVYENAIADVETAVRDATQRICSEALRLFAAHGGIPSDAAEKARLDENVRHCLKHGGEYRRSDKDGDGSRFEGVRPKK